MAGFYTDRCNGPGGFACIPGSHKSNLPCPQEVRYYQANPAGSVTQVPMRAGDMLIFTEALTHSTYPGTASHHRRAQLSK